MNGWVFWFLVFYIAAIIVIWIRYLCNTRGTTCKICSRYKLFADYDTEIQQHKNIVENIYSFCPHCFSFDVEKVKKPDTDGYCWVCNSCNNVGPYNSGEPLLSLLAWHHETYMNKYYHNVQRKNTDGQANC